MLIPVRLVLVRYLGIVVIETFGDVVDSFMVADTIDADVFKLLVIVELAAKTVLRTAVSTAVADWQHTPTSS